MSNLPQAARERLGFLVCFAVKEEAAFAWPLPMVKDGRDVLITGMGRRNTSEQFRQALDRLNPDRVLTCGFAGALNPELKIGDVLFDEDYDSGLAAKLGALGAKPAKFYCSTRVAVTVAEKTELRRTTGADAVEMESAVIRTLCREQKISSATIRVISDAADEDFFPETRAGPHPVPAKGAALDDFAIQHAPGRAPARGRVERLTCQLRK